METATEKLAVKFQKFSETGELSSALLCIVLGTPTTDYGLLLEACFRSVEHWVECRANEAKIRVLVLRVAGLLIPREKPLPRAAYISR